MPATLYRRQRLQHLLPVALELRGADACHLGELAGAARTTPRDLGERSVVEDDESRDPLPLIACPGGAEPELPEDPARSSLRRAAEEEVPLRPRDADVEEPPLLGDRVFSACLTGRELAILEERQEDRLELEPPPT